jgi:hypothetical protein
LTYQEKAWEKDTYPKWNSEKNEFYNLKNWFWKNEDCRYLPIVNFIKIKNINGIIFIYSYIDLLIFILF